MHKIDLTQLEIPDDAALFDMTLAGFANACTCVAKDLGIFDTLARSEATAQEIAEKLDLSAGALQAICQVLAACKVIRPLVNDRFGLEAVARSYLCTSSPTYSGPVSPTIRESFEYKRVLTAAKEGWSHIKREHK